MLPRPAAYALVPWILALAMVALASALDGCVDRTPQAEAGAALYARHCASCHGTEGRGDGPLAAALTARPSDLTTLSRRAGGHFDELAVMATIDGRRQVAAHGPREMPVWGAVFERERREAGEPFAATSGLLDARALADYLRSLQER